MSYNGIDGIAMKVNTTLCRDGLIVRDRNQIPFRRPNESDPWQGRMIVNPDNGYFYYGNGVEWIAGCCPGSGGQSG